MQSRRGGCDSALPRGEHGLVVVDVALIGGALSSDIGRQWRAAEIGDGLIQCRAVECEGERDLTFRPFALNLGVEMAEQADPALVAEADTIAFPELLCR